MPDAIYFQWQNEFLRRTIYPLRETKLRDFLLAYFEIDTWAVYQDKTPAELKPEIDRFLADLRGNVTSAFDRYHDLLGYVLEEDVTAHYRAEFPTPDAEALQAVNTVHQLFKRFFPTYNNPVKERYFTAARIGELETLQKRLEGQVRERQRALRNMGPTWGKKAEAEANVQRWQTAAIPMLQRELARLYQFLEAQERLAQFRKQWQAEQARQQQQHAALLSKQQTSAAAVETHTAALQRARRVLARYQQPPDPAALRAYFTTTDVGAQLNRRYAGLADDVIQAIQQRHQVFAQLFGKQASPAAQRGFIAQRITEIEPLVKTKNTALTGKLRALGWTAQGAPQRPALDTAIRQLQASVQALEEELALLQDFLWSYDRQAKPAEAQQLREKAQAEVAALETKQQTAQAELAAQAAELAAIQRAMAVPEKEGLVALASATPVTVRDIVRGITEKYHAALLQKTDQQLLEEIVQRFLSQPQRYPLWLQYMVIHFSGMRYQSAHGSWADPKQILLSLRIKTVEDALKSSSKEAIAALCEQKWLCYSSVTGGPAALGSEAGPLPALAKAKDPTWRERITRHAHALDPARGLARAKVLLDVRVEEEQYEVEQMTDQQALDELEGMRERLPDWLWQEIVRLTDLRLKQVKSLDWEQVALNDPERYRREMQSYNQALIEWKRSNLTGWREEHERASQLIVTRAVCNEVAEHIQHLRGHKPPGGLTARPEWYLRAERDPRFSGLSTRPYLRKLAAAPDFRPGASILWLRWVRKEPNAWQVAIPIALNNGDELIPMINDATQTIVNTGKRFQRVVTTRDAAGTEQRATEWLRWMHEATVVDVAETADGPTVLTFETARPGDDRSQSSIGLFRHSLANLRYVVSSSAMNATFTGFLPEASLPYDDLKEMLDWNHILLRPAYTAQQIQAYWQAVTHPPEMPVSFSGMFREEVEVEAAPLTEPERLVLYEARPAGMQIYQPEVSLQRGAHCIVSKSDAQEQDGEQYYLVTDCPAEPRAQDLYVRAREVIEVAQASPRCFTAKRYAPLFRLERIDARGLPVFQPAHRTLREGAQAWVSTIHRAGAADLGDGVVRGQRRARYYLIVACDEMPDRQGYFVRLGDLQPVD